jgi:hypothetical protein
MALPCCCTRSDRSKLVQRIGEANAAIPERIGEVNQDHWGTTEERLAIEFALNCLKVVVRKEITGTHSSQAAAKSEAAYSLHCIPQVRFAATQLACYELTLGRCCIPTPPGRALRKKKRVGRMSFKGCAVLAGIIVAASLPTSGNSPVSLDRQRPMAFQAGTADMGKPSPMTSQGCIVFRSALQSASTEPNGFLNSAWNVSRQAEPPLAQEKIVSLPEPGTGALLTLGFVAVTSLAASRRTSRLKKAGYSR